MDSGRVALFEDRAVRREWRYGKWYFVVEDVVKILTDTVDAADYIKKLRKRDEILSGIWDKIIRPVKVETEGGRQKMICADDKGILRIIQSIPSPKAEPFKQWLATVGSERISEIGNPELAAKRAHDLYVAKGYSKTWIEQRERGIHTRNSLTDEWRERGLSGGRDYAILTNDIYKGGFGLTAKQYKDMKGVPNGGNLRDWMTNLELALTNLGEATATELHRERDSFGASELEEDVKDAGKVMKAARKEAEKKLGRPVVTEENEIEGNSPLAELG